MGWKGRTSCFITTLIGSLLAASVAHGHPMGENSMNQYVMLRVAKDGLHVGYRIDFAETPTTGELRQLDIDGDGKITEAEKKQYLMSRCSEWAARLTMKVNGKEVDLKPAGEADLKLSDGTGGRKTLLVMLDYLVPAGALPAGTGHAELSVGNYSAVAGWREAAVLAGEGWWVVDDTGRHVKAKVLDQRGATGEEGTGWVLSFAFAPGKSVATTQAK